MQKLVIAEKSSVAQSIAAVIGAKQKHDGYLTGNGYTVSWCLGHLAELSDASAYNTDYARWSMDKPTVAWPETVVSIGKQVFDLSETPVWRKIIHYSCFSKNGSVSSLVSSVICFPLTNA